MNDRPKNHDVVMDSQPTRSADHPQAGAPVAGEALKQAYEAGPDSPEWHAAVTQTMAAMRAQPHRSEPDQGDSRARFEAFVVSILDRGFLRSDAFDCVDLGSGYALPFIDWAWTAWKRQASEQRSAGAMKPIGKLLIDYGDEGICCDFEPDAEFLWSLKLDGVYPLYLAAPTASGDARDAAYNELIYAVGNKYPGESRHETALRYIRQAEASGNESCAAIDAARGAA